MSVETSDTRSVYRKSVPEYSILSPSNPSFSKVLNEMTGVPRFSVVATELSDDESCDKTADTTMFDTVFEREHSEVPDEIVVASAPTISPEQLQFKEQGPLLNEANVSSKMSSFSTGKKYLRNLSQEFNATETVPMEILYAKPKRNRPLQDEAQSFPSYQYPPEEQQVSTYNITPPSRDTHHRINPRPGLLRTEHYAFGKKEKNNLRVISLILILCGVVFCTGSLVGYLVLVNYN